MDRFSYINIREYLKHTNPDKIGEADYRLLSPIFLALKIWMLKDF